MKLYSQTSGEECKPAQYLAELVCLRQGKKKRIATPHRFWNMPEWKMEYRRQIGAANGLLKLFDIESILEALNSRDGNWIFSLSYKGLIDIIKFYQAQRNKANEKMKNQKPIVYDETIITEIVPTVRGRSVIDELKDLE